MASKEWNAYVIPNINHQPREELVGYTLVQEVTDSISGNTTERVVGIIIDADAYNVVVYLDPEIEMVNIEQIFIDSITYHDVGGNRNGTTNEE